MKSPRPSCSAWRNSTAGGSFDLRMWTGKGGAAYNVSAIGGVLSSTQTGGGIY